MTPKVFAVSKNRYNGGIRIKRIYGSSTVTTFLVGVEGSDPLSWQEIEGFGRTPGDRKTDAIRKFVAAL